MLNTEDFVKRIETIIQYYGLSASSFADRIGIQRSSISHLMSGRNKPSLEFVMKILEMFPDVDYYWILEGKGTFPKQKLENTVQKEVNKPILESNKVANNQNINLFEQNITSTDENVQMKQSFPSIDTMPFIDEEVEKIVFFYKNGTFKIYKCK